MRNFQFSFPAAWQPCLAYAFMTTTCKWTGADMERSCRRVPSDLPIISVFAWRHWGISLENRHIRYPGRDSNLSSSEHAGCARIGVIWLLYCL